jgi:hypothetical protein
MSNASSNEIAERPAEPIIILRAPDLVAKLMDIEPVFEKPEKHPLPGITSEIGTNNAKGLPSSQSLRELADVAKAAESRWSSSPSNAKLLAKLAEIPLPTSAMPPGGWAKSCEPVGFPQALYACFVGNRSILARHFRETEKVNFNIILLFVHMLNPGLVAKQVGRYEIRSRKRRRANPPCVLDLTLSDIADFLDPAPDQKWELTFVRPKGNTRKKLQWATFLRLEVARAKKDKIDSAVADIVQETEGSRAQVFRDYRACKQCWEGLKSIVKELEGDEAQPLYELACLGAEIINQVDLLIAWHAKRASEAQVGSPNI